MCSSSFHLSLGDTWEVLDHFPYKVLVSLHRKPFLFKAEWFPLIFLECFDVLHGKKKNQTLLRSSQKQIFGQNTSFASQFLPDPTIQLYYVIESSTAKQLVVCFLLLCFCFCFFHFSVTGTCQLSPKTVSCSRKAISDTTRTLRSLPQCQCVSFLYHLLSLFGTPFSPGVWTQPRSFSPLQQKHQSPRLDQRFFFQGTLTLPAVQSLLIKVLRS